MNEEGEVSEMRDLGFKAGDKIKIGDQTFLVTACAGTSLSLKLVRQDS